MAWDLPSLKRLELYYIPSIRSSVLLPKLPKHLQMLSLPLTGILRLFSCIRHLYPEIEVLDLVTLTELGRTREGCRPSVRHVGLQYQTNGRASVVLSEGRFLRTREAFFGLADRRIFPNIERVRCCDFEIGKRRPQIQWLPECLGKLERLSIRLEDPTGNLVVIDDAVAEEI